MNKKRVLVVEDNALTREILREILSRDYDVLEAENGQVGLEVLKAHKATVSLVFLDVMMPVMDGYTFLDHVRADRELSLIPVIVTTQSSSEDAEVIALSRGATDFVPKPYRPEVILHRAASLIKLRESAVMVNRFKYDRLTGLYTREFFYQRVGELLAEHPDTQYSIVCSNIVNFKVYNDAFGAAAGDRLLRQIAEVTREAIGKNGLYARYGADRFLCMVEQKKEIFYRKQLEEQERKLPELKNVNMKWGVYQISDRSLPVEQMCDRAFLAADSIKSQYNQHIALYDDVLRDQLLREQIITESMETALKEEQFTVYLQPKYSLHDDRLSGAEALVRWIHPVWGFMSPGDFIPLFEKNGFITQLDRYVWEKVCSLLHSWREKGYPELEVSVNVSRADVYQDDLPQTLMSLVEKYGIEPRQLHLELTESAYTENPNQIIATVDHLRDLGFIVEMDDFGSGYSSLNMLNQMNLDILKLDMKFIQTETAKPAERGIMRFVVNLARWLNLSMVAEGVETRAQLDRLREVGCDYVQGYLLSKPLPIEAFEELMLHQLSQPARTPQAQAKKPEQKVLVVVDTDAAYLERVRKTFENQYQVVEAQDAISGFACVKALGREKLMAVILGMDLPDGGADRFLQMLRSDPVLWRVPVLSTLPQSMVCDETVEKLDTDDFLCKNHPMCDMRRRANRMISVSETRKKAQAMEDEANRDFLTGLLNRRGMDAAMESLRREDRPVAVYVFDLDGLKQVNESCGHEQGDNVLNLFARVLRRSTRDSDILCRYGGDEFVVILRNVNSRDTVLNKGEMICQEFRKLPMPQNVELSCSGGAVLSSMEDTPNTVLLGTAFAMLNRAKQEKKGGCILAD